MGKRGIYCLKSVNHETGLPLPLEPGCACGGIPSEKCNLCGWNPEVNNRRRQKLHAMASRGRLAEWGM